MRLFIAIDLDEPAREAICAEQARLMKALGTGRAIRWVKPADMHLTLAFIGEADEARTAAVVEIVRPAVPSAPFTAALEGLGLFPPRGAPSVIWLGIGHGAAEVVAVQRVVSGRLEAIGIAPDRRPYHPHVTLGRWRTATPADRQRALAAERGGEIARSAVTSVTVYESRLSSGGAAHIPMLRVPLGSDVAGAP